MSTLIGARKCGEFRDKLPPRSEQKSKIKNGPAARMQPARAIGGQSDRSDQSDRGGQTICRVYPCGHPHGQRRHGRTTSARNPPQEKRPRGLKKS
jgi:hypothetical protein